MYRHVSSETMVIVYLKSHWMFAIIISETNEIKWNGDDKYGCCKITSVFVYKCIFNITLSKNLKEID